ncbi:hypothetical protein ACFYO0_43270 [Streptomyces sp. NPDC006365]|uniref:hypothetical protein n=1 Tax=Streptomyces sp. NPDC006365 TaxID=3364744 RepID=UPI0036CB3F5A
MSAGRSVRTLRAAMFAVVCVLFAVQGHVMTSGVAVPGWALAAGAVAAGGMAWGLAGRERGLFMVGSLSLATQVALHAVFSLAQAAVRPGSASLAQRWVRYLLCTPPGSGTHSDGTATTAHSMSHGMAGMSSMDASASTAQAGHLMGGMSLTGMLAAHLAAALLGGLWLAHGERAAFRILRVLAGWLVAPLRLPLRPPTPPYRPRVRAPRGRAVRALRQLLLVYAITSRGPPAGPAVL